MIKSKQIVLLGAFGENYADFNSVSFYNGHSQEFSRTIIGNAMSNLALFIKIPSINIARYSISNQNLNFSLKNPKNAKAKNSRESMNYGSDHHYLCSLKIKFKKHVIILSILGFDF